MIDKCILFAIDGLMALHIGLLLFDLPMTRLYWVFFLAHAYLISCALKKPAAPYYVVLGFAIIFVPFLRIESFTLLVSVLVGIKAFRRLF